MDQVNSFALSIRLVKAIPKFHVGALFKAVKKQVYYWQVLTFLETFNYRTLQPSYDDENRFAIVRLLLDRWGELAFH